MKLEGVQDLSWTSIFIKKPRFCRTKMKNEIVGHARNCREPTAKPQETPNYLMELQTTEFK
ncbi:MAG: hypothetical protein DRR08_00620 [Candidatus Parabeggiatoa sp. nov. 2]|nr:MAG: hypothetical protein DRR08_00620 [Gammaproteobacteria bacterium]